MRLARRHALVGKGGEALGAGAAPGETAAAGGAGAGVGGGGGTRGPRRRTREAEDQEQEPGEAGYIGEGGAVGVRQQGTSEGYAGAVGASEGEETLTVGVSSSSH